jgi:hypothetical protein
MCIQDSREIPRDGVVTYDTALRDNDIGNLRCGITHEKGTVIGFRAYARVALKRITVADKLACITHVTDYFTTFFGGVARSKLVKSRLQIRQVKPPPQQLRTKVDPSKIGER